MATLVQRYINPASVGGNGTTDALTGANAAYASVNSAFIAEFAARPNLVTNDEVLKFTYKGGTDDNMATGIGNQFTTDATRYVWIEVDPASRHAGVTDAAKARMAPTDTPAYCLQNISFKLVIDGMQLNPTAGLTSNPIGVGLLDNSTTADVILLNCIYKPTSTTGTPTGGGGVVSTGSSGTRKVTCVNCLFDGGFQMVQMNFMNTNARCVIYYCTGVNQYKYGIQATDGGSGKLFVKNNRIATPGPGSSPQCFRITSTTPTTANNYTGDATSPDGAGFQNKTFTWAGASDYHIVSGDTFTGASLAADPTYPINTDVDGQTRTAFYAGFDEYSASVTYHDMTAYFTSNMTAGAGGGGNSRLIGGGLLG